MLVAYFAHTPDADAVFDAAMTRSLNRSPSLEDRLWGVIGTDAGRAYVDVDAAAVREVAVKIVRGLAFLRGRPLRRDAAVGFSMYEIDRRPSACAALLDGAVFDAQDAPSVVARMVQDPDAAHTALWELVFFDSLCCAVAVRR